MKGILDVNARYIKEGKSEPWQIDESSETLVKAELMLAAEECEICHSKKFSKNGIRIRKMEGLARTSKKIAKMELTRHRYLCGITECNASFFSLDWPYEGSYQATPGLINAICTDLIKDIKETEGTVGKAYGLDEKQSAKKVSRFLSYYVDMTGLSTLKVPPCNTLIFLPIKQTRNTRCVVLGVLPKGFDHAEETVLLDVLDRYSINNFKEFAERRNVDISAVKYIFTGAETFSTKDMQTVFPCCAHVSIYPPEFTDYLKNLKSSTSKNIALSGDSRELMVNTIDHILNGYYTPKERHDELSQRLNELRCSSTQKKLVNDPSNDDKRIFVKVYPYEKDCQIIADGFVPWLWGMAYQRAAQISADKIKLLKRAIKDILHYARSITLLKFKLLYQYNICYNNSNLSGYTQFLLCHSGISNLLSGSYFYVPIEELVYVQNRKSYIGKGDSFQLHGDYFNAAYRKFIADLGNEFFAEIFGQNQGEYRNWLSSVLLYGKNSFERNIFDETEERFWALIAQKMENDGWPLGSKYIAESPDRLHIALLQILDHIQLKVYSDYFTATLEE